MASRACCGVRPKAVTAGGGEGGEGGEGGAGVTARTWPSGRPLVALAAHAGAEAGTALWGAVGAAACAPPSEGTW